MSQKNSVQSINRPRDETALSQIDSVEGNLKTKKEHRKRSMQKHALWLMQILSVDEI
ncbi:hypothetical protein ACI0FR_02474 [Paenochrobactrum sp. BZR 201-1]